ncbi:MAG: HAD family acid phosphatase [Candidatus Binatia bacterium]
MSVIMSCTATPSKARQNEAPSRADNRLDAILWQTTSAEYRVLAQMIYATAQTHLERALADPNWSALSAQKDNYQKLPPAVIMDIDETVIDTGAFQSQLARNNARFSSRPWREWQARNQPEAVPGALEFIAAAQARGVTIFFVTNRDHPTEAATRLNLATTGVKLPSDLDTVLCRSERPDWGSDKESRRRYIAQSHRVLMLIGDDLADFISEYRTPPAQRTAAAVKHDTWGTKWFMLPNPMYGSWEASLYDFRNDLGSEDLSKRKFDQLR